MLVVARADRTLDRAFLEGADGLEDFFQGVGVGGDERIAAIVVRPDNVSGTDIGNIGRRKPFSVPDTFFDATLSTRKRWSRVGGQLRSG